MVSSVTQKNISCSAPELTLAVNIDVLGGVDATQGSHRMDTLDELHDCEIRIGTIKAKSLADKERATSKLMKREDERMC